MNRPQADDQFVGARCRETGIDPELFWTQELEAQAKLLCNGSRSRLPCPVRELCLRAAMREPVAGVWGGTNPWERTRFARQSGKLYILPRDPDAAA